MVRHLPLNVGGIAHSRELVTRLRPYYNLIYISLNEFRLLDICIYPAFYGNHKIIVLDS